MAVNNILPLDEGATISNDILLDVQGIVTFTAYGDIQDTHSKFTYLCHVEKLTTAGWVKILELTPQQNFITVFSEGTYRVCRIKGKVAVDVALMNIFVDFYSYAWSAGSLDGFDITTNVDGTVNISSGSAVLRDDAYESAALLYVEFPGINNLALNNKDTNYIILDYSPTSPSIRIGSSLNSSNEMNSTALYIAYREGTNISRIDLRNQNVDSNRKHKKLLYETESFKRILGGSVLGVTGARHIQVSSGGFYFGLNKVNHPAFNTLIADSFEYFFRNGSGDWNKTSSTQFSCTEYDNGTGALSPLDPNYYCSHWIYIINDHPSKLLVQYGQTQYSQLEHATEEQPPTPPEIASGLGVLIGRILVKEGSNTPERVDSAFVQHFTYAHSKNHNETALIQGGATNERYHLTEAQWLRYDNLIESPANPENEDLLTWDSVTNKWEAKSQLNSILSLNFNTVYAATTVNIDLEFSPPTLTTLGGNPYTPADGDVVFVKDQTDSSENGYYEVNTTGSWVLLNSARELSTSTFVVGYPGTVFPPSVISNYDPSSFTLQTYNRNGQLTDAILITGGLAKATQAEAEAGIESTTRTFSPLRIKQAIVALSPPETDSTIGNLFNSSGSKSSLINADLFGIADSTDGFKLKKYSWLDLKNDLQNTLGAMAYINDAPTDNKTYGRKNNTWEQVNGDGIVIRLDEPFTVAHGSNIVPSGNVGGMSEFQSGNPYTCSTGDVVYLKGQTTTSENGIYRINLSGVWDKIYTAAQLNEADLVLIESYNVLPTSDPTYRAGTLIAKYTITGVYSSLYFIGSTEEAPADSKLYVRRNVKWVDISTEDLGYVQGPVSSVEDNIATFNSLIGKKIKDSGYKLSDLALTSHTHSPGDITGPTYTLPIASVSTLGGIKVGTNLSIDGLGVLSATASGGSTPGGLDKQLQYNDNGALGGVPKLLYDKTLGHLRLGGYTERVLDLGTIGAAGTINLDVSQYRYFTCTLGSAGINLAFINGTRESPAPTIDLLNTVFVFIKQGVSAYSITWPVNIKWHNGAMPALTNISLAYDVFSFTSFNIGNPDEFWIGQKIVNGAN